MKRIATASALLALIGSSFAFGQQPATPAKPAFTPGLGEFMTFTKFATPSFGSRAMPETGSSPITRSTN